MNYFFSVLLLDSRDESVYSNSEVLTNPSLEEEQMLSHHARHSSKRSVLTADGRQDDAFDTSPRAVKPLPKGGNSIPDKQISQPFQFGASEKSSTDLSASMAKLNAAAPVFQPSFSFHAPFEGNDNLDPIKEDGIEPVKRQRVDNGKLTLESNSLTVHTEERALSPGALKMRTFKFPPDKLNTSVDPADPVLVSLQTSLSNSNSESSRRSLSMSRSGRGVLPVQSSFGGSRDSDFDANHNRTNSKFEGGAYFSPNRPHAPIPTSFPASVDGSFSGMQLGDQHHQSMPSYHSARMKQVGRSSIASSNDIHKVHLVSDSESSMLSSSSIGSLADNIMPSNVLNEVNVRSSFLLIISVM